MKKIAVLVIICSILAFCDKSTGLQKGLHGYPATGNKVWDDIYGSSYKRGYRTTTGDSATATIWPTIPCGWSNGYTCSDYWFRLTTEFHATGGYSDYMYTLSRAPNTTLPDSIPYLRYTSTGVDSHALQPNGNGYFVVWAYTDSSITISEQSAYGAFENPTVFVN